MHAAHESRHVRLRIGMLDSIVVRMTEHTRRFGTFGVVTTSTLFNVLSRQIGVTSAAASVSTPDCKSRNPMTCRERSTEPLRTILVTVVAKRLRVVARLAFACPCFCIHTVGIQIVDIVNQLSRKSLRLIIAEGAW